MESGGDDHSSSEEDMVSAFLRTGTDTSEDGSMSIPIESLIASQGE